MYADSILSLIVPLCTIVLVFATKRIIPSLLAGILMAGLMMGYASHKNIFDLLFFMLEYTYKNVTEIFYKDSTFKLSNLYVFGFLFLLGVIIEIMSYSGGISAFVKWAKKRIKTARGVEFLTFIAGIVIFIDGYFNALIVGQATKSLNDANQSSRERLAYIVDSTSTPMCALVPISSLGAYMLGVLATLDEKQNFFTLLSSVWGNYYAWFAILAVFLTILWQINLPAMQKNKSIKNTMQLDDNKTKGNIAMLILPIIALIVSVGFLIFYSGYRVSNNLNPMAMLAHTDGGFALFWGGLFSLLISLSISWKRLNTSLLSPILKNALISMLPISLILILAWSIGSIIKNDLQTGIYLANLTKQWLQTSSLNPHITLPLLIFLVSSLIAFCTGTSWGTLAIMLPIGLNIANINGVDFALVMSAVLSGAIYGDHASPISDTTILSATGAGCSVQNHFITQLPYANLTVIFAFLSFGVASMFDSILLGHIVGIFCLTLTFLGLKKYNASLLKEQASV